MPIVPDGTHPIESDDPNAIAPHAGIIRAERGGGSETTDTALAPALDPCITTYGDEEGQAPVVTGPAPVPCKKGATTPRRPRKREPVPDAADLTDVGNAHRFVDQHGETLRYCPTWDRWLVYEAGRWRPDDTMTVDRLAVGVQGPMLGFMAWPV